MNSKQAYKECMAFYLLNDYISNKYTFITDPKHMIKYLCNIGWNALARKGGEGLKAARYIEKKLNGEGFKDGI